MRFGGTGNTRGYAVAVVQPFTNGTSGTLAIGTIVRTLPAGSADFVDSRVDAAPTENGTDVLGVIVGSYEGDDQTTFVPVAPGAGKPAAVMTSGIAPVLIASAVTRGHFAFVSSTAGQAKSSATMNPGAFARVVQTKASGSARMAIGTHGSGNAYATPALTLGTANAAGSASSTIRSDATIAAFDTTVPTTATFGATAATGSVARAARRDHAHGMPANPTTGTMDGNARVAIRNNGTLVGTRRAVNLIPGTNVSFTMADDAGNEEVDVTITAAGGAGTPGTGTTSSAVGDATDHGASTDYSRTDHRHGREAFGSVTSQTAFGGSSANGVATTVSRSDHTHGTPTDPVPAHVALADPHTGYILESLIDAKGDLIAGTAADTPGILTVGANDQLLTADSTTATGLAWIDNWTGDLRLRAKNTTGSAVGKGKVVYIVGATGGTPEFALSDASTEPTSSKTIGITREAISNNAVGYITVLGIIKGLNTAAYAEGDNLWLSTTAGEFTDTRPTAPDHGVHVGYVVKSDASNGEVYVYVQNGFELQELHNVLFTSLTSGDNLQYNGSLWVNAARFDATVPSTIAFGDAAATGSATVNARRDHVHGAPADPVIAHVAAPDPHTGYLQESVVSGLGTPALTLGTTNVAGTGTTVVGTGATIAAFDATAPGTAAFGDSAATGSATVAARRDHTHGMPADPVTAHVAAPDPHTGYLQESVVSGLGTPALTLGTTNAAGTGTTVIGTGATIAAFDATVPTTAAVGDTAATGSATVAARRDHAHGMPSFGTVTAQTSFGAASADGVATTLSRADHAHGTPANPVSYATPSIALGTAAAAGAASTVIRSDATIAAFDAVSPSTISFGDSAATGSAVYAARRDHTHAAPANPVSYATPAIVLGTAAATGSASTLIRSDATIAAFDTTVPEAWAYGQTGATGSAAFAARRDHVHGTPTNPILDAEASTITVTNSAVETDFLNFSVPGGTLGTDRAIRVVLWGRYLNNSGGNRAFILRVRYGATTMFQDQSAVAVTNAAQRAWRWDLTIAANGATDAQTMSSNFALSAVTATTSGTGDLAAANNLQQVFYGTSSIDSTVAQTLRVTFAHASAAANLTVERRYAAAYWE